LTVMCGCAVGDESGEISARREMGPDTALFLEMLNYKT
jgi:hypothetical protein